MYAYAALREPGLTNFGTSTHERCLVIVLSMVTATTAMAANQSTAQVAGIVSEIRHADYAGDREKLQTLYGRLVVPKDGKLGARVRYWRGFAMWRRAINGFNDGVNRAELQRDLEQAQQEFQQSAKADPGFADAKIGELGCLSLIGYIQMENGARIADPTVQKLFIDMRRLRSEAETLDSDNPRLLWVMGPNVWKSPPERGGGESKAIEMYLRGLKIIRERQRSHADPLEPTWGEPELLMNLAYSNLNRQTPDLRAAEQYVDSALQMVPDWHYVRDILKPQIEQAKKKP